MVMEKYLIIIVILESSVFCFYNIFAAIFFFFPYIFNPLLHKPQLTLSHLAYFVLFITWPGVHLDPHMKKKFEQ